MGRLTALMTASLASLVVLTGCGTSQDIAREGPTDEPTSASPTAGSPTAVGSTPHGDPIGFSCDPVVSSADANDVVGGTGAIALVEVDTTDAGDVADNARLVTVRDYAVLAGSLDKGPLTTIEVASSGDSDDLLEAGHYAVLLGVGQAPGSYYLAGGVTGSFLIENDIAYRRCPYDAATEPGPGHLKDGIRVDTLAGYFDQALGRTD